MANTIMHLHVMSYENHKIQGYLESPFGEGYYKVDNSMQFYLTGDELMDENRMPQATAESRSFRREKEGGTAGSLPVSSIDMQAVKKTFHIRVVTRQNNSWQGAIYTETKTGERVEKKFSGIIDIISFIESQMNETEL